MRTTFFLSMGLALLGCGNSATGDGGAPGDGSTMSSQDGTAPPEDGAVAPGDAAAASGDAGAFPLTGLDEPCEGGPTGRQLLAFVESSYAGTYTPPTMRPAGDPWRGSTAASALTLTASYDGGAIECIPAPPFYCCPGCPCRTPPPPSVMVNLDVAFRTADGTLDESFVAAATFDPDVYSTSWAATLPRSSVKGSYAFSAGATDLAFTGTFRNAMAYGTLAEDLPPAPDGGSSALTGGAWNATGVDGGTD